MITAQPLRYAVSNEIADKLWAERKGTDAFLHELRQRGAFKAESTATLKRVADIPLGKAKDIVHFSPVWSDTRETDEQFHETLVEALHQAGWENMEETHAVKHAS